MWQEIIINGNSKVFIKCQFENVVNCVLYNVKESYQETSSREEILERAKQLNKRIEFNESTKNKICDSLKNATPIEAKEESSIEGGKHLLLKYKLGDSRFKFEWFLQKQTDEEFKSSIFYPIFDIIPMLSEQIRLLTDTVHKKDIELKQFKIEGQTLRRSTVVTQPFDIEFFENKFKEANDLAKSLQQIGDAITKCNPIKEIAMREIGSPSKLSTKTEYTEQPIFKLSPRSRKRKALQIHQKMKERNLNKRKRKLEYESSQSQSFFDDSDE